MAWLELEMGQALLVAVALVLIVVYTPVVDQLKAMLPGSEGMEPNPYLKVGEVKRSG